MAAWWYSSNDHPLDKASYDVSVAAPADLETIANADAVRATIDRTPEITAYLASLFGPYPFEAQGAVVVPATSGWRTRPDPHAGTGTTAEQTQARYDAYPADNPFWDIVAADPGPGDNNFHTAVYYRGAFALQSLRVTVGDAVFFTILRTWAAAKRGGNATTEDFIAHAERVAGRQLDDLFQTWLHTPGKPSVGPNDPF